MGQDELKVGLKATTETVVTKDNTAISMKSGDVEVFATPAMVALMEEAAVACVSSALPKDQTSVGTYLEVKHLAATPVGMKVKAEATLEQIDGKRNRGGEARAIYCIQKQISGKGRVEEIKVKS